MGKSQDFMKDYQEDLIYELFGQANGVIVETHLAAQNPHFELQGDCLVRVTRDKTTGAWCSQILNLRQ